MRILLISWYFPPANDVAALRVGRMVEYLRAAGHDVWILTSDSIHADKSLPVPAPPEQILRTAWFDIDQLALPWRWRARKAPPTRNGESRGRTPVRHKFVDALNKLYTNLVRVPDRRIGWLPYALRTGSQLLRQHPIDCIYASGPPFTTFLAARFLSRKFRIPWIAEYRDGWSRYVYTLKPAWREAIDERIETKVTSSASGIVTVSEPWATYFRERFQLPTIAVYNGFDPENFPLALPRVSAPHQPVSIVHMGALYEGVRDPSVLYTAILRSGLTPREIQIFYYGTRYSDVYPLVEKCGVGEFVTLKDRVPYRESLKIQRTSDVLLLLQSPLDPRNVPAKIFEYLASCRPILGLGLDEGVPAKLIRERAAGYYVTDAGAVADQLVRWVKQKKETGLIADLPFSNCAGLTRTEQFSQLDSFLRSIVEKTLSKPREDARRIKTGPLVTVVIPARDSATTISRAIESVLAQSYRPIEIIVVDDFSADNTRNVVESYASFNVRLLPLSSHKGVSVARNTGIEAANGDLIAFLDSDDEWLNTKLEKQVALMTSDKRLSLVFCEANLFSSAGDNLGDIYHGRKRAVGPDAWKALLAANFIATPAVLVRREDILSLGGFDPVLKIGEDQDMWIRLALRGHLGYVPQCLVRVYERPGSLSSRAFQDQLDYTVPMIERHFAALKNRLRESELRAYRGERLGRLGRTAYNRDFILVGFRMIVRSMALGYHPLDGMLHLITSAPPVRFLKIQIHRIQSLRRARPNLK